MKKGQAANETAMVIGFMVLFFISFFAVISDKFVAAADNRIKSLADDLADVVDSELSIAATTQEGYSRVFTLPASLDGKDYGVLFYNRSNTRSNFTQFVVSMSISGIEYSTARITPENIEGVLSVGDNLVRKRNGMVNLTKPLG